MSVIFELRQIYSESRKRSSDKLNDLVYLRFPLFFFFFGVICCPNSSTYHYERFNDRRIQEFGGEGFRASTQID